MTRLTVGSLFSGGGGFDIGALMAGYKLKWAVEYDKDIAAQYIRNLGNHMKISDILDVEASAFGYVDLLHASPPCPSFSSANRKGSETQLDRDLSSKVCEFIEVLRPAVFTLENVRAYAKSQSWQHISQMLLSSGYNLNWWILNAADYGVPQTRHRMIAIARRDGKPVTKPVSTHSNKPEENGLPKWIGWYDAVKDLVPTFGIAHHHRRKTPCFYSEDYLPEIVKDGIIVRVESGSNCEDSDCRGHFANWQRKRLPSEFRYDEIDRAYLFDGGNAGRRGPIYRNDRRTSPTITTNASNRVFLPEVSNATGGSDRFGYQPSKTITIPGGRRVYRIALGTGIEGKVVRMTTQAIALLQSFPYNYVFPAKHSLTCKIIGNSVPPLMARAICLSTGV